MPAADTPRLAVLIDADNISARHADAIFEEISKLGEASIRRIYGDFAGGGPQGWTKEKLAALAIVPHQTFANTTGKNASDIALVIDAMDILHSGRFDGFVLISSDSDFTRLASRIREQGLDVYGIGAQKTPQAFVKACKRFIYVENLEGSSEEEGAAPEEKPRRRKLPPSAANPILKKAIEGLEDEDGWFSLSALGSRLQASHPDFDARTYGFQKLGELVEKTGLFEIDRKRRPVMARLKPTNRKG